MPFSKVYDITYHKFVHIAWETEYLWTHQKACNQCTDAPRSIVNVSCK